MSFSCFLLFLEKGKQCEVDIPKGLLAVRQAKPTKNKRNFLKYTQLQGLKMCGCKPQACVQMIY